MFKKLFKKKKTLKLILLGAAVVVAAAAVYFLIAPQIKSNDYRSTVTTKQPELRSQFEKFIGILDRDIFTKSTPELSTIRSDIKASKDITADTREAFELYGGQLTDFTELPLLTWNPAYKNAVDLNSAEKTYSIEGIKAIEEMEAVLAYYDSIADQTAVMEAVGEDFANIGNLGSIEEIEQTLAKGITNLGKATTAIENLSVPESLQDQHKESLVVAKKLLSYLKQFNQAIKDSNLQNLESIANKIQTLSTQYTKDSDKFNKEFTNESKLRKHIDAARQADSTAKKLLES